VEGFSAGEVVVLIRLNVRICLNVCALLLVLLPQVVVYVTRPAVSVACIRLPEPHVAKQHVGGFLQSNAGAVVEGVEERLRLRRKAVSSQPTRTDDQSPGQLGGVACVLDQALHGGQVLLGHLVGVAVRILGGEEALFTHEVGHGLGRVEQLVVEARVTHVVVVEDRFECLWIGPADRQKFLETGLGVEEQPAPQEELEDLFLRIGVVGKPGLARRRHGLQESLPGEVPDVAGLRFDRCALGPD